ncbi:MAG: N-acetylmuramoyl-L-alanine amidase [Bacteroidetes bacterium]|nr:N-acetylmuramoyl-L-alanine amidase [Bacteroidota bacterium]
MRTQDFILAIRHRQSLSRPVLRRTPGVALLLALALLFPVSVRADVASLRVVFGERAFSIPAFAHQGVLYASVNEFSDGLGFPSYESADAGKIEIRIGDSRLKMTAGNPFVVVIAHGENTIREVVQLPLEVMRTRVAYYVPLAAALPLISRVWGKALLLDQEKSELVVTSTGKPIARVTGVLPAPSSKTQASTATQASGTMQTTGGSPALAPRAITAEKASSFDVPRISVDTRRNGTLIRIHARGKIGKYESDLKDGRLVVDLPGISVDANELRQTPTDGQGVTTVEAEQLGANARITFTLNERFTSEKISRDVKSGDLLVSLIRKVDRSAASAADRGKQNRDRSKWKLDCIVIDPGHGGRDPGAIGVSGIKEKNIVLGIGLKLGRLIEKGMPGVKVVYTRKDDTFIPLHKRGKIANAAQGKLFVSIHCNSTEAKPSSASGFEVYILRPGRTKEAIRIAEFENSVVKLEEDYENRYAELDDESFILVNMAQSAYVKYSEQFAEIMHEGIKKNARIPSKGVKQAGFYVLVGASMPGVLIESGFLSNTEEEKFLASNAGQEHLAQLYYEAILQYAKEYEKSISE